MSEAVTALAWPLERLGEVIEALAHQCGLLHRRGRGMPPPTGIPVEGGGSAAALDRFAQRTAAQLGLDADPVHATHPDVKRLLRRGRPALLRLSTAGQPRFLALLGGTGRTVSLLSPDLRVHEQPMEAVTAVLAPESPFLGENDRLLERIGVRGRRRERVRQALLQERLAGKRAAVGWLLRPTGNAGLTRLLREAGVFTPFVTLVAGYTSYAILWVLSWWLLGQAVLEGYLDSGWLFAWGLILLTAVPLRLMASFAGGRLAIRLSAALKRQLLAGALRLDPDEIRDLGSGQLLGRAVETEQIEQLAIGGGLLALTALIELVIAAAVLGVGAVGWPHVVLLAGWVAVGAWLGTDYFRRLRRWTQERLDLTGTLVEGMVGHRTRLVQEPREDWNAGADRDLAAFYALSQPLDRAAQRLQALLPRGWFALGMLTLAPAFVVGGPSIVQVAASLGGVILAYQAFRDVAEGLEKLLAAAVSWERIGPFWRAATAAEPTGRPELAEASAVGNSRAGDANRADTAPLIDVRGLGFHYPEHTAAVLQAVNLKIHPKDRLLVEGRSGGGKSTLGKLLAGLHPAQAGLLLLDGLDHQTLGREGWSRRVLLVPQFHENHVFLGTFAFNLLLGRRWPPTSADLEEAEHTCHLVGLGPLLERMPGGLQQWVGETGWQLSHGERDRLYVARALLQGSEVLILDESVSALDPQAVMQTLGAVLEREAALIVIAHP